MKIFLCIIGLLVEVVIPILGQCTPSKTRVSGSYSNGRRICSGDLILSENFDSLNQNLWNHELTVDGNGNGEFQEYVNDRSVSFIENGKLVIQPKVVGDVPLKNGYFNPVQSARMTTAGRFAFTYGILETRAKLPAGDWLWPAIWLLAQNNNYGGYPHSGEIDLMESRGNKNLIAWTKNIGPEEVAATVHFGQNYDLTDLSSLAHNKPGFDNDFHLYKLTWTPDYIAFSVDGKEIGRVTPPAGGFYELGHLTGNNPFRFGTKMAPFDRDFYILLNVAVGGTSNYFPDKCINPGGKPWKSTSKQAARDFWNGRSQWRPTWNEGTRQSAMQVDYVKVWAL
ncbi:beta-1,3-glucan-binding protein-like [Coccinella septempunctata]|uniref:beta-1,3-glucan-binding protein-like n=1 Tax=Coccinella septempunctata TaxID=41139 RepID=UPI001D08F689|nr:beta-1,3-glucan-binding protein-like [Coccinella septempunctata]